MANPTGFTWVDPTAPAGAVAGYEIGVRQASDATHSAGNYAASTLVSSPTATSEPFTALSTILAPGTDYLAAIRTKAATGYLDSVWTAEVSFSTAAVQVDPPTSFTVA
jgi:hypothetical protein